MAEALRPRWRRWFERKQVEAGRLHDDRAEAVRTADLAFERAQTKGRLRQGVDDLQTLVRLVRAWGRGEYREVSRTTVVLVLGALVYFVSPIDAIIDVIPIAGYLDDAAIIGWVLGEVRAELDVFRAWESQRQLPPITVTPPA